MKSCGAEGPVSTNSNEAMFKAEKSNILPFVRFMGFYVCSCLGCPTAQKPTCFLHVPLLFLSRPARLSVRWPQNCFYKCRSHCSIALQPNRITRLFSYSKEVERRERLVLPLLPIMSVPLVQQQRRRHAGHCSFSFSTSSLVFSLCPDFTKPRCPHPFSPPPLNKYTSVA